MLSATSPTQAAPVVYKNEDRSVRGLLLSLLEDVWCGSATGARSRNLPCVAHATLCALLRFRKEKDSKNLFAFICILASFMVAELVYGFQANSLGLLSDAFHVSFHCLALFTSLIAMILARKPASFAFSYGYDRCEVVAAFTAANCLIFVRGCLRL
jgi:Co/Zn/Cd efflux system component